MSLDAELTTLTPRQERVLAIVRDQKGSRPRGITTMEIYATICAERSAPVSYATLRNELVRLREMALVWSYGAYVAGNAMCWHPDPPEDAGRAHPAVATA